MNKRIYKVEIIETLTKIVEVEASSEEEAVETVVENYGMAKEGYVLGSEDYSETSIEVFEEEE